MKVSFEGIGDQIVSFVKGSGAEKGVFVKLGASSTVAAAGDGDCFAGLCVKKHHRQHQQKRVGGEQKRLILHKEIQRQRYQADDLGGAMLFCQPPQQQQKDRTTAALLLLSAGGSGSHGLFSFLSVISPLW